MRDFNIEIKSEKNYIFWGSLVEIHHPKLKMFLF